MDSDEIVVHEIEGNGGDMVLKFFAESVRQSSEPANTHSHIEVLPLNETRRNVLGIGPARNRRGLCSNAFRWTVAGFLFAIFTINLVQHRVINFASERILNSGEIGAVSIRGELHAIGQAACKIVYEFMGASGASISNEPRDGQLGVSVNRCPSPDIAESEFPLFGFGNVRRLGIHERPNLIALNAARFHVADVSVVILRARSPNIQKEAGNCVSANAGQPRSRTNRVSFNEATNDFDLSVFV